MNEPKEITKGQIIELLDEWIRQRPGLEFCNYGDYASYRSEMRSITKDLHDAKILLQAVEYSSLAASDLMEAFKHAYSGRLSLTPTEKGWRLDYCTGQYFPTEYRKAACAVLSQALWDYHRSDFAQDDHAGDSMRKMFRRRFGALARRWFN